MRKVLHSAILLLAVLAGSAGAQNLCANPVTYRAHAATAGSSVTPGSGTCAGGGSGCLTSAEVDLNFNNVEKICLGTVPLRSSGTLPATCAVGELYERTGATDPGLYHCTATNTWELLGSGGAVAFADLTGTATDAQIPNTITIDNATLAASATALAANPSDCAANQFATTIAASGNLSCAALVDADVPNTITVDNATLAATATALAADGSNCSAGSYAIGVDASGASQGCTVAATGSLGGALGSLDNAVLRADGTGGVTAQGSGVTISDVSGSSVTVAAAIGDALAITATAPTATTGASQAGKAASLTASPAVASTDTAGAAAGGAVTIEGGAAARLTSGDGAGGTIHLVPGARIGSGAIGGVAIHETGQTNYPVLTGVDSSGTGEFDVWSTVAGGNLGMIRAGAIKIGSTSEIYIAYGAARGVEIGSADYFGISNSSNNAQDNSGDVRLSRLSAGAFSVDTTTTGNSLGTITAAGFLGNATTSTALAANPADCSSNQFATTIAASGALTCAALVDADVPNTITVDNATLAATATALAANPTDCSANQFANTIAASGNLSCAAIADADVPDSITVALAAAATALAANPADCSANQFATTIAASGALTCAALVDADVPNTITVDNATLAATATALAANPTDCSANQFANTIAASGNLSCAAIADADVPDSITVALAATATALAANPADCSANQFATTIAASGALTCAGLVDADVPNTITVDLATLATTATTANAGDSATSFFSTGTLEVAIGGTNLTSATDDNVMVGNGTTWQSKAMTDCTDSGGNHLNYTASSNTFSCGTTAPAVDLTQALNRIAVGGAF